MRRFSLLAILWAMVLLWRSIFAQQQDSIPVPETVKKNCLLTQSVAIDFCPEYRSQIRESNLKLSQKRTDAELKWQINLYDTVNADIASFRSEKWQETRKNLETKAAFLRDYEFYITNMFVKFFDNHTNEGNLVPQFFKTTYFNNDQSGLGISQLSLYTKKPERYNQNIVLQLSLRNFSPNQISNIEDVYCFSTLNNQDYIYPMNIKPSFSENSITNLIIELKAGISPLFETIGQKKIACTLVYNQFWETKYTNRWKLVFDITDYSR